ncbi:MAG: hypothetical protein P4L85_07330 [Paludisphaera borealis]|uniref:hypothetical protein n=1 Tax=Paludisphaera borealis TaxID=1387353 RepID=UPI00283ED8CD|nr:hypothetical protein [Paludisphaera borealis]MDR3619145.1 hypothetical protein [Paludisphaera borealis]
MNHSVISETDERIGQLEAELARLRRETLRIKRLGAAALLGVSVIAGMGATYMQVQDVVAARKFVVVDPNTNKERITLGFNNTGAASIWLNDEDGSTHLFLAAARNGEASGIEFFDIDKQKKVEIGVNRAGQGLNINGRNFP